MKKTLLLTVFFAAAALTAFSCSSSSSNINNNGSDNEEAEEQATENEQSQELDWEWEPVFEEETVADEPVETVEEAASEDEVEIFYDEEIADETAAETIEETSPELDEEIVHEVAEEAAPELDEEVAQEQEVLSDREYSQICANVIAGMVTNFPVGSDKRTFILTLPQNPDVAGPFAVIFNWHGFGDTATNMSGLLASYVNNPGMPFILVTPEDLNIQPPTGFDWDNLKVNIDNREAKFFDEVLSCLRQRYNVDDDRIYTVGFSAGAIMSDGLGVVRGDVLAAIVSYSGGYFSNPVTYNSMGMLQYAISWTEMTTQNKFAQVFLTGGPTDNYNLFVKTLQFNELAQNDVAYLGGMGHDTVYCDHSKKYNYTQPSDGHTLPADFMGPQIIQFFKDHPKGTFESPYRQGLPANFPSYCEFKQATAK